MILLILLSLIVPIIFSLTHTIIGVYITLNYGNGVGVYWNGLGFITKSMFTIFMTFLGVLVFNMDFKIYIPILCSTWFICHICEAFYIQSLINNNCSGILKSIQLK